ncbi:hypothetical protein V8C26DRAFT_427377 [Trichoderma gracile]
MEKGAKGLIDQHPRREQGDKCDAAEREDQCPLRQSLDQSSEDKESRCMTPTSEGAEKSSDDAVAVARLRVNNRKAVFVVSKVDEQTSSELEVEAVSSTQGGCNPYEDGGNTETEDGNVKDHTEIEANGKEDDGEEKAESEVEGETKCSSSEESEAGLSGIELPLSPWFNPFDSPETNNSTSACRDSHDGIPSVDDTSAQLEPSVESLAKREWTRRKEQLGENNESLDKVMDMVGIEAVKAAFLEVKDMIDAARSRRGHLKRQALSIVMMGNPGTGKRTLARLYAGMLRRCGVWGQNPGVLSF